MRVIVLDDAIQISNEAAEIIIKQVNKKVFRSYKICYWNYI